MKNTSKPVLILKGIGKDYLVDKKPFNALSGIDLAFPETGFVSILGPSGCGKTTLLNIIGGLDRATYGELYIEGKSTKDYKDKDWDAFRNRRVGFVFQSYNLIEHYSVLENVETPLLLAGEKPEERKRKALEALKGVGLEGIEKKRPNQLSGGQMQRVAIARAIASNPDIIMADEPTGALDSKSSKAVAEILKAASEKTLVILVTHNRELAEKYSDRIIEMEDGKIVSDSAPLPIDENLEPGAAKDKTSMGFWTALVSSAKNIVSKKVRTLLTAIASSVGIAGVALVLSLNNGFSDYVSSVEGQMASSVPITIEKRTMGWESTSEGTQTGIEYPDDDTLYAYESTGYSYVVKTNDLSREYVDYVKALVEDQSLTRQNLASDVLIQRDNLNFNILTSTTLDENDEDAEFFMVDQYRSASSTTYRNAIASATNLPSTIFHSLYGVGEPGDVSSQYDLIYGEYPTSPNDLVLIVDTYNQVNVSTLRALGIIDESEGGGTAISFQDIVEKKVYKAYLQKDFYSLEDPYEYSDPCYENVRLSLDVSTGRLRASASGQGVKTGKAYTCPGTSPDSYKDFYFGDHNAIELRIAGILRPSRNSFLTTMPCSIGYLPSLMDMFMAEDNEVKDTLAEAQRTGWYVPAEKNGIDGLENLNSVLASVSIDTNLSSSTVSSLFDQLADCLSYCSFLRSDTDTNYKNRLTAYGQLSYSRRVGADYKENDVALLVDPILAGDYSTLPEILNAFISSGFFDSSSENLTIMDFIAYAEAYSLVTSILVFPASMTTKEALRNYLDAYNDGKEASKQVTYMDAMSDFTDAIGEMVSVISIILVVFASISLVVSSIMMAVITYVSVLERTKEIGILRACGARKKDVGRLFEAECVIVGAIAGLIGILVALLLGWPLNAILQASFSSMVQLPSMAVLSWWIALILLLVGIVLALVSGLIPARIAARKDPVVALRSE